MNKEDITRIRGTLASSTIADMLDVEKSPMLWGQQIKLGILDPGSTIDHDLLFDYTQLDTLEQRRFMIPDNTTINGSLILRGFTHLVSLPANLKVAKDLELRGAKLKELPAGLTVGGILDLTGNEFAVKIPPGTKIGIWMEGPVVDQASL